jgi:sortase B
MKGEKEAVKNNNRAAIVVCVVLMLGILLCAVILAKVLFGRQEGDNTESTATVTEAVITEAEETTTEEVLTTEEPFVDELLGIDVPEKDIDWDDLWAQNGDVYAWIYIPNTLVDYPVLQHPTEDNYYLDHNMDGSTGYPGCVYSQLCTSKNFTDPVTIFYAHDMKNGSYFHTLHYFDEEAFFDENRYVYIYTPEHTFVYEIFATKVFSDDLIPLIYDFDLNSDIYSYIKDLTTQEYSNDYVREGVEVTTDSHILTLSTCIGSMPNNRWLVNAVLVNESELDF